MKLGLLHPPPEAPRLKLAAYHTTPIDSGPPTLDLTPGARFGLFQNDLLGSCVDAAIANLASVQAAAEGRPGFAFDEPDVLGDYFDQTGGRDTGLVLGAALARVQERGFPSKDGAPGPWKVDAWATVDPQNVDEVCGAAAMFRGLVCGLKLPRSILSQPVVPDEPWRVADGPDGEPDSLGGHCVLFVAYSPMGPLFVTWGRLQRASWPWWLTYCSEAIAVLDDARAEVAGTDLDRLRADLRRLS